MVEHYSYVELFVDYPGFMIGYALLQERDVKNTSEKHLEDWQGWRRINNGGRRDHGQLASSGSSLSCNGPCRALWTCGEQ